MLAMTTHRINTPISQSRPVSVSILGLIFFLLGAPHIYSAFKGRSVAPKAFDATPYAAVAVLAVAIATAVELSIL